MYYTNVYKKLNNINLLALNWQLYQICIKVVIPNKENEKLYVYNGLDVNASRDSIHSVEFG